MVVSVIFEHLSVMGSLGYLQGHVHIHRLLQM
jgi:hypothetical protein